MKSTINSLLLTAFITILISSCKKEEDKTTTIATGSANPVVKIKQPSFGSEVHHDDSLSIEVSISHTEELHDYLATIKYGDKDSVLWKYAGHSHDKSFTYKTKWKNNVTRHVDSMVFKFEIEDHEGRKGSAERKFHAHLK
jgi:hypothetical protein